LDLEIPCLFLKFELFSDWHGFLSYPQIKFQALEMPENPVRNVPVFKSPQTHRYGQQFALCIFGNQTERINTPRNNFGVLEFNGG
jgi:hypothetical protein